MYCTQIEPLYCMQAAGPITNGEATTDVRKEGAPSEANTGASPADPSAASAVMAKADAKAALMAAFAGDDVVAEFEAEKEQAVKESIEGVEDVQEMRGWGTWASSTREPRCASAHFGA